MTHRKCAEHTTGAGAPGWGLAHTPRGQARGGGFGVGRGPPAWRSGRGASVGAGLGRPHRGAGMAHNARRAVRPAALAIEGQELVVDQGRCACVRCACVHVFCWRLCVLVLSGRRGEVATALYVHKGPAVILSNVPYCRRTYSCVWHARCSSEVVGCNKCQCVPCRKWQ